MFFPLASLYFIIRMHKDAIGIKDSTFKGEKYKTPKGHIVYGGGGIYPDEWLKQKNIIMDTAFAVLWDKNLLNEFFVSVKWTKLFFEICFILLI